MGMGSVLCWAMADAVLSVITKLHLAFRNTASSAARLGPLSMTANARRGPSPSAARPRGEASSTNLLSNPDTVACSWWTLVGTGVPFPVSAFTDRPGRTVHTVGKIQPQLQIACCRRCSPYRHSSKPCALSGVALCRPARHYEESDPIRWFVATSAFHCGLRS